MPDDIDEPLPLGLTEASRQQTAKRAAQILEKKNKGFVIPSADQKRILLVELAKKNQVAYGKAFDILKLTQKVDLNDPADVERKIRSITLCEVKATGRKNAGPGFNKHFFSLTAAEVLVAQSLKNHYRFVFVNILTKEYLELSLSEVFARAKGIYPSWSIQF